MSIITFLKEQKTHLIYIAVIFLILAVGYNLVSSKPKEIITTQIQTKLVDRNIVKTKTQYIDRIIVKKDVNGTITTTTEKERDRDTSVDKSKLQTKNISKTEIINVSHYTLGVLYPLSFTNFTVPVFNPLDLQVIGGMRVFNSPILLNLGTNIRLNQAFIGLTVEF